MKYHYKIIKCKDSGSVYNVHIFDMYEGADSCQNKAKVLQKYFQDIEEVQIERFSLCGHKVKIFLGVAYHFLHDCYRSSYARSPKEKSGHGSHT